LPRRRRYGPGARYDVQPRASGGMTTIEHPQAGRLELSYEKLAIAGDEGVTLVIFHAEPDSPSAQSLQPLASMAALHLSVGKRGPLVPGVPGHLASRCWQGWHSFDRRRSRVVSHGREPSAMETPQREHLAAQPVTCGGPPGPSRPRIISSTPPARLLK
jgi:hypothetical protein